MRMVLGRLHGLHQAYLRHQRTGSPAGALLGAIQQAELQRVHAQFFAKLINGCFHGEGGRWSPGRPVGRRFWMVHQHVRAFQVGVGNVVGTHDTVAAARNWGTGESARLVDQVGFSGHQFPIVGCSQFYLDVGGGGGPAGFEDLGPAHGHFNRTAGFARQQRGHRLRVEYPLGAKPATDLHGYHSDLGDRQVQQTG